MLSGAPLLPVGLVRGEHRIERRALLENVQDALNTINPGGTDEDGTRRALDLGQVINHDQHGVRQPIGGLCHDLFSHRVHTLSLSRVDLMRKEPLR